MPLLVMFSSGHTEFSVTLQIHARENSDAENLETLSHPKPLPFWFGGAVGDGMGETLGRKWVLYCCDD